MPLTLQYGDVKEYVEEKESIDDLESLPPDIQSRLIKDHISDMDFIDTEGMAEAAVDLQVRDSNRDISDGRDLQDHLIDDTIRNSVRENDLYDVRAELDNIKDGLADEVSEKLINEAKEEIDEAKARYSKYECRIVGEIVAEDQSEAESIMESDSTQGEIKCEKVKDY